MRIAPVIAILLLLYGVGAYAESRQAPTSHENRIHYKNNTSNQYQPTDSNPAQRLFKVQLTPPPKNDPERKEYDDELSHKSYVELGTIAIAGITAIILFAQLFVFWIQARRLSDTVRATEKAANAAKKSAEALTAAERAWIFVNIDWPEENRVFTEKGTEQSTVNVRLINAGKTPAILTRLYSTAFPMETYPDRKSIGKDTDNKIPAGVFIGSDKTKDITAKVRLSNAEWTRIEQYGDLKLLCYGRIEYQDMFGIDHTTGFCWEWSPHESHRCFYISNNKDLNYYT